MPRRRSATPTTFVRPALTATLCLALLGADGRQAPGASRPGPAWCGTSVDGFRDAYWAHREHVARGGLSASSDRVQVGRQGEIAVVVDPHEDLVIRPNPLDLQGSTLRFTPRDGGYAVAAMALATVDDFGEVVFLSDDDSVPLSLPFAFPFYSASHTTVHLNSDGNLTFGRPDPGPASGGLGGLLAGPPRVAPFFADLDPGLGQSVSVSRTAERLTATWKNVLYSGSAVSFQATLWSDGRIDFSYPPQRLGGSAVVGLAPGDETLGLLSVDLGAGAPAQGPGAIAERFADGPDVDAFGLARLFFRAFTDEYEQLVVYSTRRLIEPFAYSLSVKRSEAGIGLRPYDLAAEVGSRRLETIVVMDDVAQYPDDPEATCRDYFRLSSLAVLAHEVGHRWLAFVDFKDGTSTSGELVTRPHWNWFLDTGGSPLGGNTILPQVIPGRFVTGVPSHRYSPLDQYLMGLRAPEEVPPFFLVRYADPRPEGTDQLAGFGFQGTRKDVTVQDVIAAMGPRVPDWRSAPRVLHQAFVLLAVGGPPSPGEIAKVDRIRLAWEPSYSWATEGRGSVETVLH